MKPLGEKNKNPFKYALSGWIQAIKTEKNLRFDLCVSILVIIAGFVFKINFTEWIICVFLIGAVLSAELMNTAVETVVDMYTKEINEYAKRAKDIAAGAVMILALCSAICGLIIFVPKVLNLFNL